MEYLKVIQNYFKLRFRAQNPGRGTVGYKTNVLNFQIWLFFEVFLEKKSFSLDLAKVNWNVLALLLDSSQKITPQMC